MKRIVACFALLLMTVLGCRAQDTVCLQYIQQLTWYGALPNCPVFPDDFTLMEDGKSYGGLIQYHDVTPEFYDAQGYYRFTEDTLTVYGVAAVVGNNVQRYDRLVDTTTAGDYSNDTSSANSYIWLMLFEAGQDTLYQLVDTAPMYVHTWQRPTYYLALDLWQINAWPERKFDILPVYERYFPQPVEVVDSFYVGILNRKKEDHVGKISDTWLATYMSGFYDTIRERYVLHVNNYDEYTHQWYVLWAYVSRQCSRHMLFPILAPPDSTWGGEGTESVQTADLVSRYTNVTPNPASQQVRITSSFGLKSIEAFDAAGRRFCRVEAHGMAGTLDVSAWPRGTYVLHITTLNGTAVKKLIVE